MKDIAKRRLMFLLLCIPARYLISFFLYKMDSKYLRYMGLILLGPVLGWIYIYLTGSRKTGGETFGAPIWWNFMRPIHASLYLLAGLMALNKDTRAWIPIFIDTTVGLLAFINYHFI